MWRHLIFSQPCLCRRYKLWSLCHCCTRDTPKVFQRAESVWAACSNKLWRLTFNLMVLLPHLLNSKVKRDISNYHIWNVILILWPVVFYLLMCEELIKEFCVCERAYACVRSVRAQMLEPILDPSKIRIPVRTFTPRGMVPCCTGVLISP